MSVAYYTIREPSPSAISHPIHVRVTREKQKATIHRVVARNTSGATGYVEVWIISSWGDILVARQTSLSARTPIIVDTPIPVSENTYVNVTFVSIAADDVLEVYVIADVEDA
jgi:hypothetical protein